MSNVSKCFSCVHKNDYDPKFGYYGCNLSGHECKGYSMFEPKAKPKPSNVDRIRAMSDEELAEWIERIRMLCANDACGRAFPLVDICYSKAETPIETSEWLKQEAT